MFLQSGEFSQPADCPTPLWDCPPSKLIIVNTTSTIVSYMYVYVCSALGVVQRTFVKLEDVKWRTYPPALCWAVDSNHFG